MNSALLSSKKMDYCTPQGFFDALNAEFHFTLDAAATEKSAKCKNFYTPETDGLTAQWNIGGGSAFCNPPYGRALGAWVRKAYEEAQAGTTVVLLIPARTDTAYFHDYIYGKAEIRFCADGCTLRTRTGTGSRLHRFRRWSLSTTEIINA
nr:MAG: DNA N-6-adenine-methyltransferase [Bacteriophage sp.]